MRLDTTNPNYQIDRDDGYQLMRQMKLSGEFYWRAYCPNSQFITEGSKEQCIRACKQHKAKEAA